VQPISAAAVPTRLGQAEPPGARAVGYGAVPRETATAPIRKWQKKSLSAPPETSSRLFVSDVQTLPTGRLDAPRPFPPATRHFPKPRVFRAVSAPAQRLPPQPLRAAPVSLHASVDHGHRRGKGWRARPVPSRLVSGDGDHEEVPQPAGAQPAEDGAGAHVPRLVRPTSPSLLTPSSSLQAAFTCFLVWQCVVCQIRQMRDLARPKIFFRVSGPKDPGPNALQKTRISVHCSNSQDRGLMMTYLFGSLKLLCAPTMLPCHHTSCR
jgi:hypothetical protein